MNRFIGKSAITALSMAAVLMAPGLAHAGSYNFQTFNNPADLTFNQLLGINNSGTIAGYFGSGATGHPNQGYTFVPPNSFTSENFPNSVQTQVTGINNTGTTVGFWSNSASSGVNFGFVDQRGTFTNVNNPLVSSTPSVNQLLGVNDHNVAVGFYNDAGGNSHGYTYTISTKTFTPVNYSAATSLTAAAINNSGEIGGFYTNSAGTTLGFLDKGGTFTSLNAPNATATMFFGLNNNGMAVGQATINGATDGIIYNWLNNSWQELSDPLGIGTTTFNGINDAGTIVGFYVDSTGNTNGLRATPVPEPASLLLLATGLLGIALVRRRR